MLSPRALLLTAVMAAVVMAGASVAQAQTVVQAKVPFEFSLNGQTFPSGAYTFTFDASERGLLTVRNWAAKVAELVMAEPESEQVGDKTYVLFNRYKDRYFFSRLVVAGEDLGMTVPRSAAEREMAANVAHPEVVTVGANH
jgi:hypothetical protein